MRSLLTGLAACVLPVLASAQFGAPRVITGNYPNVMTDSQIGDVDQDGHWDVIAAARAKGVVFWYKRYEAEHFEPGRIALVDLDEPSSVVFEDLDGDGVRDLAVATAGDDRVRWARNNGFGEFHQIDTLVTTLDQPEFLRTADVDADGDPDLVVASTLDDRIAWYANDGAGHFGPQHDITILANEVIEFDLGDVDGDGDVDVLYTSPVDRELGWCANDGAGNFAPPIILLTDYYNVRSPRVCELNGDGVPDVLYVWWTNECEWLPGTGGGAFGTPQIIPGGNGLFAAWAVDEDGDGDQDIISGGNYSNILYTNNGTGVFTQQPDIGGNACQLFVQDLDEDGDLDLAYRRNWDMNFGWHYNQGNSTFSAALTMPEFTQAMKVIANDLDDDGDADLMVQQQQSSAVEWLSNDGNDVFTLREKFQFQGANIGNSELQDYDQDGHMDFLFRAGSNTADLYWRRNLGDGSFAPEVLLSPAHSAIYGFQGYIHQADLDGDGDLDHLLSWPNFGWRRNLGNGFSAFMSISSTIDIAIMSSGDLDGDGDIDVIAGDRQTPYTKWFRNNGTGVFSVQPTLPVDMDFQQTILTRDLDADNDSDIVIMGFVSDMTVLYNNGSGTFTDDVWPAWVWSNYQGIGEILDVDLDGDPDIVSGSGPGLPWYSNDGLGLFTEEGPLNPGAPSDDLDMIAQGDLDGDGGQDLIFAETSEPRMSWLPNQANSYYRIQGRVFLDLDDDGIRDTGEPRVPWVSVAAEPAPNFPMSTNNGAYLCYVDSGTYVVHPLIDTVLWRISTDSLQYTVHLNEQNPVSAGNDFGVTANADGSLVHLGFEGGQGACGDTIHQYITYANLGSRVEDGLIALDHDPHYTFLSAVPAPDSVVAGRYFWHFNDLFFYETREVMITAVRPPFTDMGEVSVMHLELYKLDSQNVIFDTVVVHQAEPIACAFDPNDKRVEPGFGPEGAVDIATAHLEYTIRFQNTGTAVAHSVTLRDTLSPSLDLTAMNITGYSHEPTDVRVDSGRVLNIRFQGINLPDSSSDLAGSQGFVSFRIGVVPGQPHLTTITNAAGIYFDNNPPVLTNTTLTTLVDCDLWEPQVHWSLVGELIASEGLAYQWYLNGAPMPGEQAQTIMVNEPGDYTAEVTSIHGCPAVSEPYAVLALEVANNSSATCRLVPNPMTDEVALLSDEVLTAAHVVEWCDAAGRVVRRQAGAGSTTLVMHVGQLLPGIYTVRITTPDGRRKALRAVVR